MAANDGGAHLPVQVEMVPDSDDPALRIPGAVAAAAIAPTAVLASLAANDDCSPYSDPATLRAGDSGQTYTGVADPAPAADFTGSFDGAGAGADAGGE